MRGFHYRICRFAFRQRTLVANAAVATLAAVGVAVTTYAAWQSWRNEAEQVRTRYEAAADNRSLAVQHGANETLTRMRGIALGAAISTSASFDAMVEPLLRGAYKRGALLVLDPAGLLLMEHCFGD